MESKVLDNNFWLHIDGVCKVFEPILSVLRLVDTKVVPTMSLLYHVFELIKKKLESIPNYVFW